MTEWDLEATPEFEAWFSSLDEGEADAVVAIVDLLERHGPHLTFPFSSGIVGSAFAGMRELRKQYKGEPYRILYCFDPRRVGVLLIGGCKGGDDRWYVANIQKADDLFRQHLKDLEKG